MGKQSVPPIIVPLLTGPPPHSHGSGPDWDDCKDKFSSSSSTTAATAAAAASSSSPWWSGDNGFGGVSGQTLAALMPMKNISPFFCFLFKTSITCTVLLYVLNQNHMLPRPVSAIVSKVLFWPTLPITASRRMGIQKWFTRMDDTVILGGAPFGFLGLPERLYQEYGVRGVINMCEEYTGPIHIYQQLGIQQLYLPTTDHFEPTLVDLETAIRFIDQYHKQGQRVYVHCRAGHGRSAAVVFAWLLWTEYNNNNNNYTNNNNGSHAATLVVDLERLNQKMSKLRSVRKGLWRQPNINLFHKRLLHKNEERVTMDRTIVVNDSTADDTSNIVDKEL